MQRLPDVNLDLGQGLTLEPLAREDAPIVFESVRDEDLRHWLPLPRPYPLEVAEAWCTTISRELWESGHGIVRCVRHDGHMVGNIDVKHIDWTARVAEIGYWTAPQARGRGYMTAAVKGLSQWLLGDVRFERVELRIATGNKASRRVAEKAGFTCEGTARNAGFTDWGRVDLVVYSRIPSDVR